MSHSNKIAEALYNALLTADPEKLAALALTIHEFTVKAERSYRDVCKQPFANAVMDTMIVAHEDAN